MFNVFICDDSKLDIENIKNCFQRKNMLILISVNFQIPKC